MTSVLDAIKPHATDAAEASEGVVVRSSATELHRIACDLPSRIRVTREEVALISAFLGEAITQILNSEPTRNAMQLSSAASGSIQPIPPKPTIKQRYKQDAASS